MRSARHLPWWSVACSWRRGLSMAAAVASAIAPALAHAGTTYVFTTGSALSLTNDQLAAIGNQYGNSTIQVIGTDSTGATVNGTPVLQGGPTGNVTTFDIAGDLSLSSTDAIVAWGSNPIQLNVAANATIASGAKISADAFAGYSGAGGGTGGGAGLRPLGDRATTPGTGGGNTSAGTRTPEQQDGHNGTAGTAATLVNSAAMDSYVGASGTTGVNNSATAAAGGAGKSLVALGLQMPGGGGLGSGGKFDYPDGTDGGSGGSGSPGIDGVLGHPGAGGTPSTSAGPTAMLHGGGGGGGGSSGGDGVAGGGGGQGGSGGGGESAPPDPVDPNPPLAYGGAALIGGNGTRGGMGASGGQGGAGGGGIGISVGGQLNLKGQISANGAGGGTASFDVNEQALRFVDPVRHSEAGGVNLEGHGGAGGDPGEGGSGGIGGVAGGGGGGAGGAVYIVASTYNQNNGSSVTAVGGAGGTSGDEQPIYGLDGQGNLIITGYTPPTIAGLTGGIGDVRINTLSGSTIQHDNTLTAPGTLNPFRSYDPNLVVNGNGANTPNFTSNIEGGVAAYGRLISNGTFDTSGNTYYRSTVAPGSIPTNAVAVAWQATSSQYDSAGYSQMYLTSLGGDIQQPGFKLFQNVNPHNPLFIPDPNNPAPIDPTPAAAQLLSGGWQSNPAFVRGATGPQIITTLAANQTYTTLTEKPRSNTYNMIVGQFAPYTNVRTFYTVYNANQPAPPLYLLDTGLPQISFKFPNSNVYNKVYTEDGVASDVSSDLQANYRAGSGLKNMSIFVYNTGHASSLNTGSIFIGSSTQQFSLPGSGSVEFTAPVSSSAALGSTDTVLVGSQTDGGSAFGSLTLNIVGPDLALSGGTATFAQGQALGFTVQFHNQSNFLANPQLSDLDILGLSITNDTAGLFSVTTPTNTQLQPGEGEPVRINFAGSNTPGIFSANLHIITDENADLLQNGQTFDVALDVTVAPEPRSASVLCACASALLMRRRRR